MKKLKTNWAPFPIEFSSCSNLRPKGFEWSRTEGIATVWIDTSIPNHQGPPSGNFGWFCESSEVLPALKSQLLNQTERFKRHFQHIFTCDNELINRDPSFFLFNPPGSNLPWTKPQDFRIPEKTKLCSMISSPKDMTSGHKLRISIAESLKGKVDLFGGAAWSQRSGQGTGPNGDWWRSKEDSLSSYMFSVVIENASYGDYYTEKITDCFALGVIPIYWGSPLIHERFNRDGIILWDHNFNPDSLSHDLYHSKIEAVKDNLERVKNLVSADDLLFKKIEILS
jgi:hypothetical protein